MRMKAENPFLLSSETACYKRFQLPVKGMKGILCIPCNKEKNLSFCRCGKHLFILCRII